MGVRASIESVRTYAKKPRPDLGPDKYDVEDLFPHPWTCECCGDSFAWYRKRDEKAFSICGEQKIPKDSSKVYTHAPFTVTIGDKTYDACSFECHRDIWMVKTLEVVAKLIHEVLKERK